MQSGVEIVKYSVNLEVNTQATIDYNEPVVLPENELVLDFKSSTYRINELLVFIVMSMAKKHTR